MNDVIYWLWLSTSPRIGPRAITSLLKYYGSPKEMYFAPVGEITRLLPRNIEGAEELESAILTRQSVYLKSAITRVSTLSP